MSSIAAATSTSLVEAINFLTRPLNCTVPQPTINSLQQILLSTLTNVPTWIRNARLTLTLASAAPPRTIYGACIATSVDWSDWFYVLGGRDFDLTIERTMVSVQVTGTPGRMVIWKQAPALRPTFIPTITVSEPEPKAQVPISKFSRSVRQNKLPSPITVDSALSRTQSKTVAQQLLQSEHEKEEADEIFAMISNLNAYLVSPTPTRECFNAPKSSVIIAPATTRFAPVAILEAENFHSRSSFRHGTLNHDDSTPSPVSSPESSRPSSPSSIFSYSSSQESLTSVSTTSSSISALKKSFVPPAKQGSSARHECPSQVAVNTSKTQVQRYLYQGGQSTVLTGGVMLGAAVKTSTHSPSAPKYRASVTGKKVSPQLMSQIHTGSNSGSWRRAVTSRV